MAVAQVRGCNKKSCLAEGEQPPTVPGNRAHSGGLQGETRKVG